MTNAYRRNVIDRFLKAHRDEIDEHPEREADLTAYEGVDEAAVDIVLNTILSRYDSFDEYLEQEFGLDDMAIQTLQEMYLV
jgi:hypothetical protein